MTNADRLITPADWRAEPWQNGRGVTRVVARWPTAGDDYDVRVSVAEVTESGPFSTFPGYQRWTTLLTDGRVGLVDDPGGATHWLSPGVPLQLDGNARISATLGDGPVTLLNILARPDLVVVGAGPTIAKVDFVFAITATPAHGLDRWHARSFAEPVPIDGNVVWLRARDRR